MISFEEALRIIELSTDLPDAEEITLVQALNRVLAQEIFSDVDMPPFDKAAMDGYACRRVDLENELSVIEDIPAGKVPATQIGSNQCARIMTGAMLPAGADYILMKEHAESTGYNSVKSNKQNEHANICYKGEDVRSGETIVKAGTKLFPAQMAMLAAAGCVRPMVYKLPGIAVISTGDELVEPDRKPGKGKIRNSNGLQLVAQANRYGLPAEYLGIVPDNRKALFEVMADAMEKYQVILISGGVSVGDYDFVPAITKELHVEILFHGMNVKPGKHLLFGKKGKQFVAGMPGNPVSSFVLFEVLVKPFLDKLTGSNEIQHRLGVPLAKSYNRKSSDLLFFIPVILTVEGTALPLEYHGSAHIHAYTEANGIMEVPAGVENIKEGEIVHVRPI